MIIESFSATTPFAPGRAIARAHFTCMATRMADLRNLVDPVTWVLIAGITDPWKSTGSLKSFRSARSWLFQVAASDDSPCVKPTDFSSHSAFAP